MAQADLEDLYVDVEMIERNVDSIFHTLDELGLPIDDWTDKINEELASWLHELKQNVTSYMD